MKFFLYTISSLLILTVYTLLLEYFPFIRTKPDVILIIVIFTAITSDKPTDIIIAFALGYIFDLVSGSPAGFYAMIRTITFIITRVFNMKFFSKSAPFFVIITLIISILDSIYLGYHFDEYGYRFAHILGDAIYISIINALAALILYPLLNRIEGVYLKKMQEI